MTASRAATRKTVAAQHTRQPEQTAQSNSMTAYYLGPSCKHDWSKLANDLQTMAAEGKTIWKCEGCNEISITYDWQTPVD